jgi:hypothetical protein
MTGSNGPNLPFTSTPEFCNRVLNTGHSRQVRRSRQSQFTQCGTNPPLAPGFSTSGSVAIAAVGAISRKCHGATLMDAAAKGGFEAMLTDAAQRSIVCKAQETGTHNLK